MTKNKRSKEKPETSPSPQKPLPSKNEIKEISQFIAQEIVAEKYSGPIPAPSPSPNTTLSGNSECPQPFRAEGHLLFDISRSEEGLYDFTLVNFATQEPQAFLARGTGPFEGTVETVVPPGDYELVVNPDGAWQADVIGDVQRYRTDCDFPETGTDIDLSARYTGCGAGCCALENGVAGCDCNSGRCYCNNDTFSDICTCSCN